MTKEQRGVSCLCGTQGCIGETCNPTAFKLANASKAVPSSNLRVKLLKDVYDDGQDHHPPGYIARKGDVVVIHSIQTAVVSHTGSGHGFVVHDGELDLMQPDETTDQYVVPKHIMRQLYNVLQDYANEATYWAPRTGGVLEGCPRGDPPTSTQLVGGARSMLRLIDRDVLKREPCFPEEPAALRRFRIGDCVQWGCNRKGVVQGPADDQYKVLVKWQGTEIVDAIYGRELTSRSCDDCDALPPVKANATLWDCACNLTDCPYCGPRLAASRGEIPTVHVGGRNTIHEGRRADCVICNRASENGDERHDG